MATPQELKRKAMDAVSHKETASHRRRFQRSGRPPASASPSRSPILEEVRRRAMDAISNVETVAQVGMVKLTGGIAAYVGRIREADREMQKSHRDTKPGYSQRDTRPGYRTTKRDEFGRDL